MAIKTPQFHKFVDRDSGNPKALILDEPNLTHYLLYIDSPFTNSQITFEDDRLSIRKYVCPKIRFTTVLWLTHVFIVATIKGDRKYKYIAVYGSVSYNTLDKFDDKRYKEVLKDAIWDNWSINLNKK